MTSSSLILGLAGVLALFVPGNILAALNAPATNPLLALVQLMGALYFSFALMNWTAKDSAIGGIYARPISLGNFSHFFSGTLILVRQLLSNQFNTSIALVLVIYAVYGSLFYWLVFHATGIKMEIK